MSKRLTKIMDGNTAAAYVSYPFTEVAAIYPITPSTEMAELVDSWSVAGRRNLFGTPVKVMEMQSEGGAAGALHGILQGGALGSTYTASQGLLLMIPNMFRMSGELLPAVFHVASRGAAVNSYSILAEHSDVMSTRQTGIAILASRSVQDAMYLGAVAHLAAIKARLPFLHFFDGFRTSHEMQKIHVLQNEDLAKLIDYDAVSAFRQRSLSPARPHAFGMTTSPDVYWQLRESANPYYEALPGIIDEYLQAINKLTGMNYDFFSYYGHPQAERVVLAMGSGCSVLEETVDALNARGEKVGLVAVHVFRPFMPAKLREALPPTVKSVAVIERVKESGSTGPLCLDVRSALYRPAGGPVVVGGRFGIAGKEFTPACAQAVYENLALGEPRDEFTVGINDDLTHTSLPLPKAPLSVKQEGTTSCVFWGLGSDGTVGANKSSVKIIGENTDLYAQAYFAYDSKKSGGVTMSHLRFGPNPIKSAYRIIEADFVACHNQTYVNEFNLLRGLRPGGSFLLNCQWSDEELDKKLPGRLKRQIAENNIKFYTLNAVDIAIELGIPGRINMIMQSAFFALAKVIPMEEAMRYLRKSVQDTYGKQGDTVVAKNLEALERGVSALHKVKVPAAWKNAAHSPKPLDQSRPDFYNGVGLTMIAQEGDSLPVSAFKDYADGHWPNGYSVFEKRGFAVNVARWLPENCIQCNQCSFVCPHSVLRPRLLTGEETAAAPQGLKTLPAAGMKEMNFHLAVSAMDCTGCGQCVGACPARTKALEMSPLHEQLPAASGWWEYAEHQVPYRPLPGDAKINVKNSQFLKPLLEFSGACPGCGETPYVKLLSQLYGDRMMISNAAGCSTVWPAAAPSVAYTTDKDGNGPAWAFSLFEDCAEYGFGMSLGVRQLQDTLAVLVGEALLGDYPGEVKQALDAWLQDRNRSEGTQERRRALLHALELHKGGDALLNRIYDLRDYYVKRSYWIFGGDGWAHDIGYGGLDHVLAQNHDVNVLVYDTEVYSNTGGQSSKATPLGSIAQFAAGGKSTLKKDLGSIFMSYGYVYVAQVALGASKEQTLKALVEAEAYPGPSLVIAYAPCINHGIKGGLAAGLEQTKEAVEVGYWPLYRYNPLLAAAGGNPFQLDCKAPSGDFAKHLLREVRYASLQRQFPDKAARLFAEAAEAAGLRYARLAKLAGK